MGNGRRRVRVFHTCARAPAHAPTHVHIHAHAHARVHQRIFNAVYVWRLTVMSVGARARARDDRNAGVTVADCRFLPRIAARTHTGRALLPLPRGGRRGREQRRYDDGFITRIVTVREMMH